jgi:hypothetical protein
MPMTLEIPDDRMAQVGLTLRRAANEFHGALARNPEDSAAPAWRASAEWFDARAQELIDAHSGDGPKFR